MTFEFRPSFLRLYRNLKRRSPQRAAQARLALQDTADCLEQRKPLPVALGLSKLQGSYWEIRSNLADRIVFYWKQDLVSWVLVGDHDEIKRFISRL